MPRLFIHYIDKSDGGEARFAAVFGVSNLPPFLTGFPTKLYGSTKRSRQDVFLQRRAALAASSLGEYALQFESFVPAALLDELSSSRRERHYGNVTTFWAWVSQIMDENASCSKAVSMVQAWCAQARRAVPSSDTGGYCTARQRLGLPFLQGVQEHLSKLMSRRIRAQDRWHGHTLKAIDGTSVQLMDTWQNQQQYPQPSTQKPGCGFPIMGMVGILNLSHGGWQAFATAPGTAHDLKVSTPLIKEFERGDLVLADRAFCSYELIAQLQGRGVHSLMRLHQARHRALDWRKGKKLSPNERLVSWTKPRCQPQNSPLSAAQWKALPATLSIRLVRYRCQGRDRKARSIIIATTLSALEHTGQELAALSGQRWDIETKIRDIKTTLGMEDFAVRTPEMAAKTLAMLMIVYNLIKAVSQQAAIQNGQSLALLGFKGVLDIVLCYRSSYRGRQHHHGQRKTLHRTLLEIISTKLLDKRPHRQEPRARKKRPKPFPLLTAPRAQFIIVLHPSKYRAPRVN